MLGRQCGLLGTIAALTQALSLDLTSQVLRFVSDLLRGRFWPPAAPFWYQVLCLRAIHTFDLALGSLLMLHANCFTPVLSAQPLISCPLSAAQLLRLKRPGGFRCCCQAEELMEGRSWQPSLGWLTCLPLPSRPSSLCLVLGRSFPVSLAEV